MKIFPISKEESDRIRFVTKDGKVNLYNFLKIDPKSSIEYIKKHYIRVRTIFNFEESLYEDDRDGSVNNEERDNLKRVIESYKVLTDPRLKKLYDTYILQVFDYRLFHYVPFNIGLTIIKKSCEVAHFLCNVGTPLLQWDLPRDIDPLGAELIGMVESIRNGFLPAMKRSVFSVFWVTQIPLDSLVRAMCGRYYFIAEAMLFYPTSYLLPSLLVGCPPSFTPSVFLKTLLVNPLTQQIDYSRIWYGFPLFIMRRSVFHYVEESLTWFKRKVQHLYITNLNSTPLRYANLICSSYIFKSIAFSMIVNPMQILFHRYQITALGVGSPSALIAANTSYWAFAKHLYQTLGLKHLFFLNLSFVPAIFIHYIYYHSCDILEQLQAADNLHRQQQQ